MPRPGELSVQRKSICGSVRTIRGAPSSRVLSNHAAEEIADAIFNGQRGIAVRKAIASLRLDET